MPIIKIRSESLGISIVKTGIKNKAVELKKIQQKLNLFKEETIFLGDDINDLTIINEVGVFAVPLDAHEACKSKATFIGSKKGGEGFFREISDSILFSKGFHPYVPFATNNDYKI